MKESEIQEPAFAFQQVPEALSAYCLSKAYIHAPVFPRVFPLVFITEILHCRGNESHHKHRQRNEYKYAARWMMATTPITISITSGGRMTSHSPLLV